MANTYKSSMLWGLDAGVKLSALAAFGALWLALDPTPARAEARRGAPAPLLEAAALASRGDLPGAARRLEAVAEGARGPEQIAALALVRLATGSPAEGAALLERALAEDGTLAEGHFWLAVASFRSRAPTRALRPLDAAVSLRVDRPEYRLARGLARAAAGQRREAEQDVVAAAREAPNLLEPIYHPDERRGLIRLAEGALRGHPDQAALNDAVTRMLHDAGLLREAETRAKGRRTAAAFEVLGRIALDRGDASEAVTLLANAAALAPGSASPRFHLARAAYLSGAPARALGSLRTAARLDPSDRRVQLALGRLALEQGDLDEAELALDYALAGTPSPDAHEGLGRVRELRGDLDGARARYEQALARAPTSVSVLERLALLHERRGLKRESAAVRRRLARASRLEQDFSALVEATRAAQQAHAALCEAPLAERAGGTHRGAAAGPSAARAFARAGALARAGREQDAHREARAVLARLPAAHWARGARPAVSLERRFDGSIVVRAAVLPFVRLER